MSIQQNESVIIANADKNLGPAGIDTEDYIKMGLDHLLDPSTYTLLTWPMWLSGLTDMLSS